MIFAALLLAAAAAEAEPELDCTRDNLAQQEMNICAAQDYEAADADLNAQWKLTSAEMRTYDEDEAFDDGRPGYYQTLLDSQRAWIAFRDSNCTVQGYIFRGGSMEPFMVSACMARMARERTAELRELVQDEGAQ